MNVKATNLLSRCLEPRELMDEMEQAYAYATANFDEPHVAILGHIQRLFPHLPAGAKVLDLGCGPGDITLRLASLYSACTIDALDGAQAMLDYADSAIQQQHLEHRICLLHTTLPCTDLPTSHYDLIFSNSLLHHLYHPEVLWDTIKQVAHPGAHVFVADLKRPCSYDEVKSLVKQYAGDAVPILQRDFSNSLMAAFTPEEVEKQLSRAGLGYFEIRVVSDRHIIIYGSLR